jgi:hypothetical protein
MLKLKQFNEPPVASRTFLVKLFFKKVFDSALKNREVKAETIQ